jgi:hypothetical protein
MIVSGQVSSVFLQRNLKQVIEEFGEESITNVETNSYGTTVYFEVEVFTVEEAVEVNRRIAMISGQ